jgi:hypothetical protein
LEHLKGTSLEGALALLTNIRLGRKGLSGTHTLPYYEHNYGHKMFYNISPGSKFVLEHFIEFAPLKVEMTSSPMVKRCY